MEEIKIALLASVPLEHLRASVDVVKHQKMVAFGSDAWETLAQLDALLKGNPTDAFIYASMGIGIGNVVSWHAKYLRRRDAVNQMHPGGMRYRPPTTENEKWTSYWEVSELRELPKSDWIPLNHFSGYGKRYGSGKRLSLMAH